MFELFQSTPPARGATTVGVVQRFPKQNFNPRPPRGGRLAAAAATVPATEISIHAPREGGDGFMQIHTVWFVRISIHAPREGGDRFLKLGRRPTWTFQSTPPARGATPAN